MLRAKAMMTTTSFTTTTAITKVEKGPLPSSSFSTAICAHQVAVGVEAGAVEAAVEMPLVAEQAC